MGNLLMIAGAVLTRLSWYLARRDRDSTSGDLIEDAVDLFGADIDIFN